MKNIKLSLIALLGFGSFAYAGGDIIPVTPYEIEDSILATESAVEMENIVPVVEEVVVIPAIDPKSITEHGKHESELEINHGKKEPKALGDNIEDEPIEFSNSSISSGAYMGLGFTATEYDTNCNCSSSLSGTDKTAGVVAKVGYKFNEYIGVEARGLKTMVASDGGEVEHVSVLVKPSVPIGESVSAYGLVGWGKTETFGDLRKTDVDGLSWGAGLDYSVGENVSLFVDYERLFQESDAPDLNSVNMGIDYRF